MIEHISVADITEQDMRWLIKSGVDSYTGFKPKHMMEAALEGKMQLWRVGDGMGVTEIIAHPAGRELYIVCLAGRNIFNTETFMALLKLAERLGCKWIGGMTHRSSLARWASRRAGARTEFTYCLIEVNGHAKRNVRQGAEAPAQA